MKFTFFFSCVDYDRDCLGRKQFGRILETLGIGNGRLHPHRRFSQVCQVSTKCVYVYIMSILTKFNQNIRQYDNMQKVFVEAIIILKHLKTSFWYHKQQNVYANELMTYMCNASPLCFNLFPVFLAIHRQTCKTTFSSNTILPVRVDTLVLPRV